MNYVQAYTETLVFFFFLMNIENLKKNNSIKSNQNETESKYISCLKIKDKEENKIQTIK